MLTRLGIGVVVTCSAALAAGWWADTPELVAVGLTGVAAIVQAMLWMLLRPDLLAVREIEPLRVREDDPARALLLVQNLSGRRSPPILATDAVGGRPLVVPVPSLAAGAAHTTVYPLPTDRRGVLPVGPFAIGFADPLRLVAVSRSFASAAVLVVHPRVHRVSPLPTGLTRDTEGPTSASSPRGGIAFHSIRPYEIGDSMRDIHWKKTAQTGQLMVCHKVVPDEPSLMVVLDTSADAYRSGGFEDAVRIAASLAVAAIAGGHPLELRTTGGDVVVSEGGSAAESTVLDLLAGVEMSATDPGLEALPRMTPGRAAVSLGVVTGEPPATHLALVSMVRSRFLMASAIQVHPVPQRFSADLPGVFLVGCRDSDDFAHRWNEVLVG